jgi:hypothetical protein
MTEQPRARGSAYDGPGGPSPSASNSDKPDAGEAPGGAPRWVKVFGIIGLVLVLLVIVLLLTGHGPGRHMHSGLRDYSTSAGLTPGTVSAPDGSWA